MIPVDRRSPRERTEPVGRGADLGPESGPRVGWVRRSAPDRRREPALTDLGTFDDLALPVADPDGLRDVLLRLVAGAREVLGADCLAAWLQGSLATGDFDDASDVDFVVAVREDLPQKRVEALQAFHRGLFARPSEWAWHLEGSYVPAAALAAPPPPRREAWYLDHGATTFERSDHDHSLVTLWSLRERGVVLAGPPPRAFIAPIPRAALEAEVRETVRNWGAELLATPDDSFVRWLWIFTPLSYCRMAETLETGEVRSKRSAVAWAHRHLEPRWRALVDRAWAERARPTEDFHRPADPALLAETRAFVRRMIWALRA